MELTKFKALLDEQNSWPEHYTFKFLVKAELKFETMSLLIDHTIKEKQSSKGRFVSISSTKLMNCSDEVVAVYQKLSKIEGIISL